MTRSARHGFVDIELRGASRRALPAM